MFGPVDALLPKTCNTDQNLQSHFGNVALVVGETCVVKNGVGNGTVPMDFLKGDFPFVVALFAVHRYHGIKSRPLGKAQFFGIFNGLFQMVVAVLKQFTGNLLIFSGHVKRQTVCLGIPIGATAIFFACKPFGSNIQTGIGTGIGLVQLENIETDTLLCLNVTFNGDIAHFPNFGPCFLLGVQKPFKP